MQLAIDPVCGMSVAAIPASLHVDTDAGTVYFCSEGCRKAFLAESGAVCRSRPEVRAGACGHALDDAGHP